MLQNLIELDRELFVYLNGLGSENWDDFFVYITKQLNWWPYFLLLIFLLLKKITPKQFLLLILVLAVFFLFTDQMTNLIKNTVQRFRPVNDPDLKDMIRIVKGSNSWSFFSGHASNSSGSTLILFLILRKYYKYAFLMFLFPLLFAYTRIYLGLHFPGDILAGYAFGLMSGFGFYKLFCYLNTKYKLTDKQNKNAFI
ncbi:undecaprenyl-diphosphatase [Flavobacterium arsenatis]|uniref:Undecaprenyl-diphosphatase n=1 Tax=Flavobacterium arsenatis TaxID=1484332 RepID=A0ABU1TKE6_9FLAO|nr:phosphatase PAP2 family protein [Flavobacterium arsenatis]MDR6966450.1 undecaprenyl-diphosphatase [Flavobacterium arsenatis]